MFPWANNHIAQVVCAKDHFYKKVASSKDRVSNITVTTPSKEGAFYVLVISIPCKYIINVNWARLTSHGHGYRFLAADFLPICVAETVT